MTDIEFRDLAGMGEFRAAERLQKEVWGEGDIVDPADLMMVIQAEGGLVGGAFAEGALVGYVFGFPTAMPQRQHSHRLAVAPHMRGRGLGARLKWYQRDWCLERGIVHLRWTFDPALSVNANLNTACLGATSRTYYEDYYGAMGGINEGIPSDRLLVDWHLNDPRVAEKAAGRKPAQMPGDVQRLPLSLDGDAAAARAVETSLAARLSLRERLQAAFAQGLEIVGFDDAQKAYLLLPAAGRS